MKEAEIEKRMVKEIEGMGGLCWKFTSPGTIGVPDRIVVLPDGSVIFVELKAEFGRGANIQRYRISQLKKCGVDARKIQGLEEMKSFVRECKERLEGGERSEI